MTASLGDQKRLAEMSDLPAASKARAVTVEYLDRAGMSHAELAERVGYSMTSVKKWLANSYHKVSADDRYIRAAICEFIETHPLAPEKSTVKGRLFNTKNVEQIARLFRRAMEHGEIVLLYGPPGTQKSFALEHLICARHRQKKESAAYVYASAGMTKTVIVRRIGRELGVRVGSVHRERVLSNIITHLKDREETPAIVVDEAQHLDVHCLEILREIHDRTGCGLVLAGSHNLLQLFMRPDRRSHLEQWLSRIDHRDQLPGLQPDEVREIAARELGNGEPAKLSDKFVSALIKQCTAEDIFAGSGTRDYLSVRRLVKLLQQFKAKRDATH